MMQQQTDKDIHIHCSETGSGTPLILLHGNGENSDYFRYQTDFFSLSYRVLAVDTRGHGRTPRGTAPFTLDQFADDLYGLMREKGIERAIILGFSDGANTAMKFALKYPKNVRALILNAGNLNPKGVRRSIQIPIELAYRMTGCFSWISARAKRTKELLGLMVNEPDIRPEALSAIHAPTLVIAGSRDMIRSDHTDLIARIIPGAKKVILPGDHFIALKQHEAFNQAVGAFLGTL